MSKLVWNLRKRIREEDKHNDGNNFKTLVNEASHKVKFQFFFPFSSRKIGKSKKNNWDNLPAGK